jgi:hypothetical protein
MPLMQRRADTPHSVTGRALSILGIFGPEQTHLTLRDQRANRASHHHDIPVTR